MSKYTISNYDKHICLKANALMIAITLFLIKPYLIAAMSVALKEDEMIIFNTFYPDKMYISLEAASSIPIIFLIYAWTRKTPEATKFIKVIWNNGKKIFIGTTTLQLLITSSPLWLPIGIDINQVNIIEILIYLLILIVVPLSQYMKDCFSDFPEPANKKISR